MSTTSTSRQQSIDDAQSPGIPETGSPAAPLDPPADPLTTGRASQNVTSAPPQDLEILQANLNANDSSTSITPNISNDNQAENENTAAASGHTIVAVLDDNPSGPRTSVVSGDAASGEARNSQTAVVPSTTSSRAISLMLIRQTCITYENRTAAICFIVSY